jgi:predicted adenine nucleotide alpha hydrolase (AANH) superfamily ATPase
LGEKYAAQYGVNFFYRDYRPGFRLGQQEAKELDLYRQKYCGCIISFNQR